MWWFGTTCAGCDVRMPLTARGFLCEGCAPALEPARHWRLEDGLPIAAAWAYSGPLQAWIRRCKQGVYSDPAPVVRLLREVLEEAKVGGPVLLVSIPPERTRLRQRGLHLPDLLVDHLRHKDAPRAWLLERMDRSPVRREHVRTPPVLRARAARDRMPVVLVDDVVTTGQTLCTAAAALEAVGQPVRAAICLADARPAVLARILGGEATAGTLWQPTNR